MEGEETSTDICTTLKHLRAKQIQQRKKISDFVTAVVNQVKKLLVYYVKFYCVKYLNKCKIFRCFKFSISLVSQ